MPVAILASKLERLRRELAKLRESSSEPGREEGIGLLSTLVDDLDAEVRELAKADDGFRQIVKALDDTAIVAITDAKGKITSVNDNFCRISGYSREELLGQDHRIVNSKTHSPEFFQEMWRTISSGKSWSGDIRNRRKNGESYWVRTVISPLAGKDGVPTRYIAVRFDITEQKLAEMDLTKAQTRLEEQHRFLTSVLENVPIMVFVKDAANDFRFTLLNKAGERLTGFKETEVVGKTDFDFFPKEKAAAIVESDKAIFRRGHSLKAVREQVSTSYGTRWLQTYKVPTFGADGEPDLLIGLSMDITDEIEAEERRKRLVDENRALLKSARFAIFTTSVDGLITGFNEEAENILGYRAEELIAHRTPAVFHDPLELVAAAEELSRIEGGNVPIGFETIAFRASQGEADERQWTYVRKDGSRLQIRLSVTPLRTVKGRLYGYMGIAKDVTNELAIQRTLEEEKAKSMHAAKMASLGEMSAAIAHEINNPLAIISGNLRLLERIRQDKAKFEAKTETMIKAATRIEKIVKGLKRFSHEAEERELRFELVSDLISESLAISEPKAKRYSTPIEVDIEGTPRLLCEGVEIEQVLINLINNSVDAVKSLEERWIRIRVFQEESELVLQVIDSGKNLPREIEQKIFQPFFTTKPVGEGTGLGLSITKTILDEHKARILINRSMENTCFEVRFLNVAVRAAQNGA